MDDIYFDALTDEDYCEINERVSCQLKSYSDTFDQMTTTSIKNTLQERRAEIVRNINLKGLLDRADKKVKYSCHDQVQQSSVKFCNAAINFAFIAYNKASSLAKNLHLPLYTKPETNKEVLKLYEKARENQQKANYFATLRLDLEVVNDIELWKYLQVIKEASRIERSKLFICNDGPYKMEHLHAKQRLLFLSGVIKKKLDLSIKAIRNLLEIEKINKIYTETCADHQTTLSLVKMLNESFHEMTNHIFVNSKLKNLCVEENTDTKHICQKI